MSKCNICILVKHPTREDWVELDLKSQPDFSTTYALTDIQKTNKPVSYFSLNVDLSASKNNIDNLLYPTHINNIENLVGFEMDARVFHNGVRVDNSDAKLTITNTSYQKGSLDVMKARLIGSRHLWISDIADIKLCELSSIFDTVTWSNANAQASWDKTTWNWRQGWCGVPVHFGLWRNRNTVSYIDLRPSTYIKYLVFKSIESLTGFRIKSQFMNSELFEGLIMPFTRGQWGVDQEYRDRNNFVASQYPDSVPSQNRYVFDTAIGDIDTQITDRRIYSWYDKPTEDYNNKNIAGNFDPTFGEYIVPTSANKWGGIRCQFLVDLSWKWKSFFDNKEVIGINSFDDSIDDSNSAIVPSNVNAAGDRIMLAFHDGSNSPKTIALKKGKLKIRLVKEDVANVKTNLMESEWFDIEPRTDDTVTTYTKLSEPVCLQAGEKVYIEYDIEDNKRAHICERPTAWQRFIRTFTGVSATKYRSYLEFQSTNFACNILEDVCGDYDLTIKGLLDGISHMFNLVFETDATNRIITIEDEPNYHYYNGPHEDWCNIINTDAEISISNNQTAAKCKKLVFREDTSDGYVQEIEEISGFRYAGQRECVQNAENFPEELVINPIFSPTYFVQDFSVISLDSNNANAVRYVKPPIWPRMWDNYVTNETTYIRFEEDKFVLRQDELAENKYDFSPRVLYFQGLTNYTKSNENPTLPDYQVRWKYENVEQIGWPYAFMIDPYLLKNYSLSFNNNQDFINITDTDFFSNNAVTKENANLFTDYWEDYLIRDVNSPDLKASIILNPNDIQKLDFRKLKLYKNAAWKLEKVSNYSLCDSTGSAKLSLASGIDYKYTNERFETEDLTISFGGSYFGSVISGTPASKLDFENHLLVINGDIRRKDNGALVLGREGLSVTFDITYNGTPTMSTGGLVRFEYQNDIDLTSSVNASTGSALWDDLTPYLQAGSRIAGGKITLILDKKAWAQANGAYTAYDSVVPDNTMSIDITATIEDNLIPQDQAFSSFPQTLEYPIYQPISVTPVPQGVGSGSFLTVSRTNETGWEPSTQFFYRRSRPSLVGSGFTNLTAVGTDLTAYPAWGTFDATNTVYNSTSTYVFKEWGDFQVDILALTQRAGNEYTMGLSFQIWIGKY
jgi:hypothetical protein